MPFSVPNSKNNKVKFIGVCALVFGFPLGATKVYVKGTLVITFPRGLFFWMTYFVNVLKVRETLTSHDCIFGIHVPKEAHNDLKLVSFYKFSYIKL